LNPRNSSRALLTLGLLAALSLALALGVGGCGSGSSSTVQASTTAPARSRTSTSPAGPKESSPGASITGYGAAAEGSGKVAVTAAAHSFFTAMATRDYAGLCSDLAAANRRQLRVLLKGQASGGCPSILKTLLDPAAATEAQKAAEAPVTSVRIKGDTAFAIFTPKGGVPSYFVMKEEGGGWKAVGLAPGTPVDPTATP
jgi:hypothetical protein